MSRPPVVYGCQSCGHESPRRWDRCPACYGFGTFVEQAAPAARARGAGARPAPAPRVASPLSRVAVTRHPRRTTGLGELDRVLGKGPNGEGLAAGQVIVLGGSPGVGKSTLLMQALAGLCDDEAARALYASGEETREQIAERARRLGLSAALERIDVLDTHDVADVMRALEHGGYATAVADSLQTLSAADLGDPGTTRTVSVVAERLTGAAKAAGVGLWLVGQATKDGRLAGPNAAAHVVDTLLWFERELAADLRVLRATKNRFGSVGEVGLFRMGPEGLTDVTDPSGPLVRRRSGARPAGAVWALLCDEDRPVVVEVQALVGEPSEGAPRRIASGIDPQRLALVLAVLERHGGVDVGGDVFVDIHAPTGRVSDRGLDLPLALAIASAALGLPVPGEIACAGQLALTGELLAPWRLDAREREAARLGFARLLAPSAAGEAHGVPTLGAAMTHALAARGAAMPPEAAKETA